MTRRMFRKALVVKRALPVCAAVDGMQCPSVAVGSDTKSAEVLGS